MELEPVALRAPFAVLVDEAAPISVPFPHGALDGSGDVARCGRRICLFELLTRLLRLGKTPCFEPLELLRNGLIDDRREIRRAREGAEPSEFFVELRVGRELNLVP